MSNHKEATPIPIPRQRFVPAAYLEGAVPIVVPKNPSTPVSKTRPAPFVKLYTGPPVDSTSEEEEDTKSPRSAKRPRRTPSSSTSKPTFSSNAKQAKRPSSATKATTTPNPASSPLSTLPAGPHPEDPAEAFAAARLESLVPSQFIASASDARHNVILPPSSTPKPPPTRYTILFDAAHALIMHQSVIKTSFDPSSTASASDTIQNQLDNLTKISWRQAKYILELEGENVALRTAALDAGLEVPDKTPRPTAAATPTPTKVDKKRKRKEKEGKQKEKKKPEQDPSPYMDGPGNKVKGDELEKQRKEREKKMLLVRKQRESMMRESDGDE